MLAERAIVTLLGAAGAAALVAATCGACNDEPQAAGGNDGAPPDTGTGGNGGSAADAIAEAEASVCEPFASPDGTVLTDPKVWRCVPDDRGCGLYVADVDPDPFPKPDWKPCGAGCEEADAVLPTGKKNVTYWTGSTAMEVEGDIIVRSSIGEAGVGYIFLITRLSDGGTVFAARTTVLCGTPGWVNDGALGLPFVSQPVAGVRSVRHVRALSAAPASPLEWSPWVTMPGALPTSYFAWDAGWGLTFTDGTLRVVTSPAETQFTIIDSGAPVYEVASKKNLVAWPGRDGTGGVRLVKAWSLQSGLQTLWSTAQGVDGATGGYVNSVALSSNRVVWIVVDGPDYKFTQAQMVWSPVASQPSGISVSEGPMIPATGALQELRAGGDFAAGHGCYSTGAETGECSIFVLQFSAKKVWKIRPRPGSMYKNVMAVSDDYVLVSERDLQGPGADPGIIGRLLRFRTDSLDALQAAW